MPHKATTWMGFAVILAAGAFSVLSLWQARTKFNPALSQYKIATFGAFAALAVTVLALFLWYYFNEKAAAGRPAEKAGPEADTVATSGDGRKTEDPGSR